MNGHWWRLNMNHRVFVNIAFDIILTIEKHQKAISCVVSSRSIDYSPLTSSNVLLIDDNLIVSLACSASRCKGDLPSLSTFKWGGGDVEDDLFACLILVYWQGYSIVLKDIYLLEIRSACHCNKLSIWYLSVAGRHFGGSSVWTMWYIGGFFKWSFGKAKWEMEWQPSRFGNVSSRRDARRRSLQRCGTHQMVSSFLIGDPLSISSIHLSSRRRRRRWWGECQWRLDIFSHHLLGSSVSCDISLVDSWTRPSANIEAMTVSRVNWATHLHPCFG